jgi:hypothetical protein
MKGWQRGLNRGPGPWEVGRWVHRGLYNGTDVGDRRCLVFKQFVYGLL